MKLNKDVTAKTEEFFALCKELTFEAFDDPSVQDGIMMLIVQLTGKVFELEEKLEEVRSELDKR